MQKERSVDCPTCGDTITWNKQQAFRPFCSQRCKDADFIDWAHEEKRIPGSSTYDDIFSASDISGDTEIN